MLALKTIPVWLPNALTMFRFISLPFILYLAYHQLWGPTLFWGTLSGITDFFDGYLARSYHIQSVFGATLDPLADKLFTVSLFFTLASIHNDLYVLPMWFAVFELCKELARIILNAVCMRYIFYVIPSGMLGKTSNAIKMFFCAWLGLGYYYHFNAAFLHQANAIIIAAIIVLELWSLGGYFTQAYKKFSTHH